MASPAVSAGRARIRGGGQFWLLVGAAGALGLVIVGLSTAHMPPFEQATVARIAHGVGEALFIAAFLAAVVDPFAKRRFALEVGRSVLLALFGRNAPQRYIDGLRQALHPDRVTHELEWQLHLSWHQERKVLTVEVRVESSVQNLSELPMAATPAWLPVSPPDSPGSQFLEYRLRAISADPRSEAVQSRILTTEEIAALPRSQGPAALVLDVEAALEGLRTPPGGMQEFGLTGLSYAAVPTMIPLVLSNPALRQELRLSGPALEDLDISVYLGNQELQPTAGPPPLSEKRYEFTSLVLPGATWRVYLQPKPGREARVGGLDE